jgi:hypothetical protein
MINALDKWLMVFNIRHPPFTKRVTYVQTGIVLLVNSNPVIKRTGLSAIANARNSLTTTPERKK